jgi:hypothetical protein
MHCALAGSCDNACYGAFCLFAQFFEHDPPAALARHGNGSTRWPRSVPRRRIGAARSNPTGSHPPDAGFGVRLAALAAAAEAEAAACREADAAGFEWPPHRASANKPPYELQPGTGRRGPEELWRAFDAAVGELNRVATGTDLVEVADVYAALAVAAADLAAAVEREDRASGLLPRARAA